MSNRTARVPSLRVWLQSTSLLTVLAGYSVLLLINQRMAHWQRLESFHEASELALSSLGRRSGSRRELERLLPAKPFPGLLVHKAIGTSREVSRPLSLETDQGEQWLMATGALDLADGSRVTVQINQDVTKSFQQERLSFWLLVAGAGISSLVTSALLRPVLSKGLVQPLQTFSHQLLTITLPPKPGEAIKVDEQPQELRPIAVAFNSLQHRLWASWEQERIFADGVAHELRTPITLISGHAQSLLRQGLPSDLTPSLHLIRSEAARMTTLVSDLLDLARLDSQRLALAREPVQADDVLLLLYERMVRKVGQRLQLAVETETSPDRPLGLADPHRLQQCLTALVDNALQYGPADGTITLASSTGTTGELILHVRDEGPGVPKDERERILERFVRGTAAAASSARGSGIGLAVVKLLMEAMGGSVVVGDAPGNGADFQLHLKPFRPLDSQPSG